MPGQLIAIFAFGLVITGIVALGLVRANDIEARRARVVSASDEAEG